jgi:hypothetical protein
MGNRLFGTFLARSASGVLPDGKLHPAIATAIANGRNGGVRLDARARDRFGPPLRDSLSDVRVHVDSQASSLAQAIAARAFTFGNDVYFAEGEYRPGSREGDRLIAHELTHVAQQLGAPTSTPSRVSESGEPAEVEADRVSEDLSENTDTDSVSEDHGGIVGRQPQGTEGERPPASPGAGGTSPAPAAADEWSAERGEMEEVRARATTRQLAAEAYVGKAAKVIETVKTRLITAVTVYGEAYKEYAKYIAMAKTAAKQEEELIDIGVGILLAVTFGAALEAGVAWAGMEAAEEGASATLAGKIAHGAAKGAKTEAVVGTATEGAKTGAKRSGLLEVVGTDLEPGGLKPEALKLKLWNDLVTLHEQVLGVVKLASFQSLIASGAEYAIGEIKAQIGGGAGADMPVADLHDLIGTLAADDAAFAQLDDAFSGAIAAMEGIHASVLAAPEPSGRQQEVEQSIWILWIAELSEEESDVLDINAIENHLAAIGVLGPGSRLGVDFGWWTFKSDEVKAIHAARGKKAEIEEEITKPAGGK